MEFAERRNAIVAQIAINTRTGADRCLLENPQRAIRRTVGNSPAHSIVVGGLARWML